MFKSAVNEAARSVKANCEPKKERTEKWQSVLLKTSKKAPSQIKKSGDSLCDAPHKTVSTNALSLICSNYEDSTEEDIEKQDSEKKSEIELELSDIKTEPPKIKTKSPKIIAKPPKIKSESIEIKTEVMDIKSNLIVMKSEEPSEVCPADLVDKPNSTNTDLNYNKSKTLKAKSSPFRSSENQNVLNSAKRMSTDNFMFALPLKSKNDDLNSSKHYYNVPEVVSETSIVSPTVLVEHKANTTSTNKMHNESKPSSTTEGQNQKVPDSMKIMSAHDFRYALPLKSDDDDLNSSKHYYNVPINTIPPDPYKNKTDGNYDFRLPLSRKEDQNSDASTSYLKSSLGRDTELCSNQESKSQNDTDYVKYFREKHLKIKSHMRSKSSPSDPVDSIARTPSGCRETQSAPSLCGRDGSYNNSADSGYISLSTDSPFSSSKCDSDNKDNSNATHSQVGTPVTPQIKLPSENSPLIKSRSCRENAESPSLKRTFSFTFDDHQEASPTPSKSGNRKFVRKSFGSSDNVRHKFEHRRSGSDLDSPVSNLSSKFTSYNNVQTPTRAYSKCTTDQSPYSPQESPKFGLKRMRTNLPYYNSYGLQSFQSEFGYIDSHCHLDFLFQRQEFTGTYTEYQDKHKDTFPKSYKGCIAIFCNPSTFAKNPVWKKILEEDNVWAAFGCHPHNVKDYDLEIDEALIEALKHPKVRALGEIGLDYSNRNNCAKETQHQIFKRQLQLALKEKLPLVIHCREAHSDCLSIMKEKVPSDHRIHLHCFTDTWSVATQWLEAFPNLRIGLTNLVTYPSAESVHDVARRIPLDRLLLETDTPYFVPKSVGRDVRWSHPGMAIHVAAQVAALKENTSLETVLKATMSNTRKMYGIE